MLKFFRQKHIAKIVFWALVILIMPAFVLLGTGSISRSKDKGPSYAGTIDGKKVSFDDLYESMVGIRSQLVLNYFGQPQLLDTFLNNRPLIAKLGWDRLIMMREAKKRKINITDGDVIGYIRSHQIFLRNGVFDPTVYSYVLRYNMGLDMRKFEEIIRQNIAIQRLKDALTKDVKISDEDVLGEYKKDNEKFKISYVLFDARDLTDKTAVDDNRVKDYYDRHKSEFTLPAKEGGETLKTANFDDVKEGIRSYLAEEEARTSSFKLAEETYKNICEIEEKEKTAFESVAAKLGLKTFTSPLFSRSDYIEGVGEAGPIVETAAGFTKPSQISRPIRVRGGAVIFKVSESKGIDGEKFKKDKDEFAKIALERKKLSALDAWFAETSLKTNLKMDLQNVDKYYR